MAETVPAGRFASTYTRGAPASSSAIGRSPDASVPMCGSLSRLPFCLCVRAFLLRGGALAPQLGHELVATMVEILAFARVPLAADGVLAEERESDGRIAVGDDCVRKHAWIHLAPGDCLRWRGARQAAPDHLIGGDLNEELIAALGDSVDLPQR